MEPATYYKVCTLRLNKTNLSIFYAIFISLNTYSEGYKLFPTIDPLPTNPSYKQSTTLPQRAENMPPSDSVKNRTMSNYIPKELITTLRQYLLDRETFNDFSHVMKAKNIRLHFTQRELYDDYFYWQEKFYILTQVLLYDKPKCQGTQEEVSFCDAERKMFAVHLKRFPHLETALKTRESIFSWDYKWKSIAYKQVVVVSLPDHLIDGFAKLFYLNQYFKDQYKKNRINLVHYFGHRNEIICTNLTNTLFFKIFSLSNENNLQDKTAHISSVIVNCSDDVEGSTCTQHCFDNLDVDNSYILQIEAPETDRGKAEYSVHHNHDDL